MVCGLVYNFFHTASLLHRLSVHINLMSLLALCFCIVEEGARKNLIVSNSNLAPPGSKMMLMSQVFKKTVAENSDTLTSANIKIHRCSHAFIYLLTPLR